MLTLLPTQCISHMLLHLSPEEQADPYPILADFCEEYTPGEMRDQLTLIYELALLNDGEFNDPRRRDQLLVFYKFVLRALEASYLITRQKTKPGVVYCSYC